MRGSSTGMIFPGPRDVISSSSVAAVLHTYKNQELQYNTNGVTMFNSSNFSGDSYINFLLGMATSYSQLEYLAGKHWVNNNYNGYVNDNWHVSPRLVLNLGLRYDGLPHAFERYDKFSNFVQADYDPTLGYPLNPDGTLNPAHLSTFPSTGTEQFYLNGIREAGVNGFPRGNVQNHYYTFQPRVGFVMGHVRKRQDSIPRRIRIVLGARSGQRRLQRRVKPALCLHTLRHQRLLLQSKYQRFDRRNDAEPLPVGPDQHQVRLQPSRNREL